MSGTFIAGETKVRPGIYKRRVNLDFSSLGGRSGTVCIIGRANWGPLDTPVVMSYYDDPKKLVGDENGTVKIVKEVFAAGAEKVVFIRVGTGGLKATCNWQDTSETPKEVLEIKAKYPGMYRLYFEVKNSLADTSKKVITISSAAGVLEEYTIDAYTSGNGSEQLWATNALKNSKYVEARQLTASDNTKVLKNAKTRIPLPIEEGGSENDADPTVTTADYSTAFELAETENFDCICCGSCDPDVHALLAEFLEKNYVNGRYAIGVVGDPDWYGETIQGGAVMIHNSTFAERITRAAAYNSELLVYVLNGWKEADGTVVNGRDAAAYVAGLIASMPATESLTHKVIPGAVSLEEAFTNDQIVQALNAGCIVFSKSTLGDIVIEKGITTFKTVDSEKDEGWMKIRRTKIRLEMMKRIDIALDEFIGVVNNDTNGRAAIIAAAQAVLDAMVAEGKLRPWPTFELDLDNPPVGDSAWFIIQADDMDSFEKGYLTYRFRFSPGA